MKNIRNIYTLLLILGLIVACNTHSKVEQKDQQSLTLTLKKSFKNIYFAKGGLEYPHTKETLNACINSNDKPCLRVFKRVQEGKKTLKALSDPDTLNTTLDIIEETCLSGEDSMAMFTCYGGIMSFYFYSDPAQDAKILSRIKQFPKTIRNMIFNDEFYWYSNRPDAEPWINYIATAEVDWKYKTQKRRISDLFNKTIEEAKGARAPWVQR